MTRPLLWGSKARSFELEMRKMAEHQHGSMDTTTQEKTFAGFMLWVRNVAILCILVLIFLAIFNS